MADRSKQVCLRTRNDKRQLTATPCVSRGGEAVCMQIITRGKTARSHSYILRGCLLDDAVYQNYSEKMVQNRATFERLMNKLVERHAASVNIITYHKTRR